MSMQKTILSGRFMRLPYKHMNTTLFIYISMIYSKLKIAV